MKKIIYYILSILELPFIILTWIDYYWNRIWKAFSGISIIFVLPSLLTMPITWMDSLILSSIIFLKYNILGIHITFADAVSKNLSRFPEL